MAGIPDHFSFLCECETGWGYRCVGNSRYLQRNHMHFILSSLLLSTSLKGQKLNRQGLNLRKTFLGPSTLWMSSR